jgi:ATP-dependent Clp endopeptidase proteolytic subunit ClpP
MNLKYRNQRTAEATARYWNKSLDRADWYKIEALSDDEAEILIYDLIGWPFNDAGEFVRSLSGISAKVITVRINSPGGDVFDAISIFNALQSHKAKIITRIESLAASSASFIALGGKEVQAYRNAMMMIHEPWVYSAGNQYDLREIAEILGKISSNMVDIYAANSNVGKRELREMMKNETWFTAKEAMDKGFIDTIVDGKAVKAAFDLSMFANVPEGIETQPEGGREMTEREIERVLRDAGCSRSFAKYAASRAAGGSHDMGGNQRDAESLKTAIKSLEYLFTGGQ